MAEKGQWVAVQKKTFTRWCNEILSDRREVVNDITVDLSDGLKLYTLLQLLTEFEKDVGKINKKCSQRLQKLNNVAVCLEFVKKDKKIPLVNIGPEDIVDGNTSITLGLIWNLILFYQIATIAEGSPKALLLAWVNEQIKDYDVPKVKNFRSSWMDGSAISALTDSLKKGCGAWPTTGEALTDATKAMGVAHESLGIPNLMDPEDMVNRPDDHSVMTYISEFRKAQEELIRLAEEERLRKLRTPVAAETVAYGPGLENGINSRDHTFTVETRNCFGDKVPQDARITVTVSGPNDTTAPSEVGINTDGLYQCSYQATVPGQYCVNINLDGDVIKGVPFYVNLAAAPVSASGSGTTGGDARNLAIIAIDTGVSQGGNVSYIAVTVKNPRANAVEVDVVDHGNGKYTASYTPIMPGVFNVTVSVWGEPAGSFQPLFQGAVSQYSFAEGPGLVGDKTDREHAFTIRGRNAQNDACTEGNDEFAVAINGPDGSCPHKLVDNNDGTYSVTYVPPTPGSYAIETTLYGTPIKGSPATASVKAAPVAAKATTSGPGLEGAFDNEPTEFVISSKDKTGAPVFGDDVQVVVAGPENADVRVTDKKNGDYRVEYAADVAGDYAITASIDGEAIPGSPFRVKVIEGAQGELVTGSFQFTVVARNKAGRPKTYGGDRWAVSINGPAGSKVDVHTTDNGDGSYSARYTLAASDQTESLFTVNALLNDRHIATSPFVHRLSKKPAFFERQKNVFAPASGKEGLLEAIAMDQSAGLKHVEPPQDSAISPQTQILGGIKSGAVSLTHVEKPEDSAISPQTQVLGEIKKGAELNPVEAPDTGLSSHTKLLGEVKKGADLTHVGAPPDSAISDRSATLMSIEKGVTLKETEAPKDEAISDQTKLLGEIAKKRPAEE